MELEIGDRVRIIGQENVGEIISIRGNEVEVSFGLLKSMVKKNRLELVEEEEEEWEEEDTPVPTSGSAFDTKEKLMNFKFELDVRGKMKDEVLLEIQRQMDDAILLGINEFRIIHGRGTGVIKTTVRHELKKYKEVDSLHDAPEHGGDGVTVVKLKG